ncbi:hypothetical protein [Allomesorhizobium camelthorni]|uniref:Uncharacterized protein n=1 Tax=Allomesorhizobium camelthorni TaxID=475069 RepID=A0A6G4W575_9HYPH|nr:hypothetical protein [Mesorhizobium camelthorni]NGO49749.1 hypothetical protein [Mesorhizobium camelthorni]
MPVKITYKVKPSNKAETLPKSPFIDKISIVLKPHKDQDAHDIYMALFQNLDDPMLWANGPKGKGFQIGKRVLLPSIVDFKRLPLFQATYDKAHKKVERIRLEFVPVDLGTLGIVELHAAMITIMPGGWEYVAKHGHVTRIDVTVDLPSVRMDGFQFLPQHSSTTMRWTINGILQNLAYGKPKGNQTLIYSRKKKRLSKGQGWSGPSVVRIERRLVNLGGMKVYQLPTLPNPFADMQFTTNMPVAPSEVEEGLWTMFCDSVQVRGLKDALLLLKKDRRTKFRKHLAAHPVPWWQPHEIWKDWKPMLASLKIASTKWPG